MRMCALVAAAIFGPATAARAETAAVAPFKDNTLYESATGSISSGAGPHLFAGTNSQGIVRRALLAFDVASVVPAGATITGATLRVNVSQAQPAPLPHTLHRLLADWGEGSSIPPAGGQGAPSTPGDATWIHRFFDSEFWSSPGGDFTDSPSASTIIAGAGVYSWTATPAMIADLQSWLDNPATNFGWMIRGGEESLTTAKRIDSRENADPAARPLLTIEYIPGPATPAVMGLAWIALGRRRNPGDRAPARSSRRGRVSAAARA